MKKFWLHGLFMCGLLPASGADALARRTGRFLAQALRLLLVMLALGSGAAHAVAITITANTNWSAIAPAPAAGDTITVKNGATLTVDVAAGVCASMQLGVAGGAGNGNGTLLFNAGSQATVSGTVTLGSGVRTGSINMTNGGTLILGQLTVTTLGTWTPGTGTVNYTLAANTILPAAIATYNNLTITGGASTATLGAATTVNGNLLISSGTLDVSASNFALDVKGNFTNNAAFTQRTGTVTMSGTAAQAIAGSATTTFSGLTITNTSAAVSLSPTTNLVNVSQTLNMNGAATLLTPAAAVVINNAAAAGTITGTGTVQVTRTAATADYSSQYKFTTNTLTNLTVEYKGTAAQTVSALTYGSLKINNSSGVTLAGNATVGTLLTLTSGVASTGANTLITSANCPNSVSRAVGWVAGFLQLKIPTGTTSCTSDIGDANTYASVAIAFGNVSTAGNLVATTVSGEHPDIANSAIDSTQDVNRYWIVTNSGVSFDNYSATFTYASGTPVDLDSGVTPGIFQVGKADSCNASLQNCTWTYPTISTPPNNTTAQATGMTGFSSFAVGRKLNNFLVEAAGGGSIGTQTQGVAFNIKITARDVNGNTITSFNGTVQITSSCTLSSGGGTSASFVNGVLSSYSVTISSVGSCTITATRTGGTESGTSNSFTVVAAVSSFDVCETTTPQCTPGAANFDRLFTKLANTGFTLDLVALKNDGTLASSFSSLVAVDLLANTSAQAAGANNCPSSQTAVIPLGNSTFSGGRVSAISVGSGAFSSVAPNYSAYRDVRVRVTCNNTNCPPSGITYCSTDNFSVRPVDFTVTSNMTNAAQTGNPALAAGADFTLTATAVAGYAGSPQLDRTLAGQKVVTHVSLTDYTGQLRDSGGLSTIAFPAATIGTGASTATVQYHDAGNFRALARGIIDSSFTSVDDPSKGDCVSGGSSNSDNDANANNGLVYGCNIANQNNSSLFGRFSPSYYVMSGPSFAAACVSGGYSYMGDAHIGLTFTISAMSQANPTSVKLTHYTSGYGTLATVSVLAENGTTATDLSGNFSPSLAYSSSVWASGDYAVTGSTYSFTRSTPSGPYDSLYVGAGVTDGDGATLTGVDFKLADPTCTVSCTHKKLSSSATSIRFGRLFIPNSYATEKLDLTVPMETQYWNGTFWQRNTLDSCTSITASNIAIGNYTGGLSGTNLGASHISVGAISQGLGTITIAKPSPAATGSAELAVNLGTGGTATICPSWIALATGAGLAYFQGQWCGSGYVKDPISRITLGVTRNKFIFHRENY